MAARTPEGGSPAQRENPLRRRLADVVMPAMGGPELAVALRAENPGLRVLYMSGYSHEAADNQGAQLGPKAGFIQRPFVLEELAQRVREALDGPASAGHTP